MKISPIKFVMISFLIIVAFGGISLYLFLNHTGNPTTFTLERLERVWIKNDYYEIETNYIVIDDEFYLFWHSSNENPSLSSTIKAVGKIEGRELPDTVNVHVKSYQLTGLLNENITKIMLGNSLVSRIMISSETNHPNEIHKNPRRVADTNSYRCFQYSSGTIRCMNFIK